MIFPCHTPPFARNAFPPVFIPGQWVSLVSVIVCADMGRRAGVGVWPLGIGECRDSRSSIRLRRCRGAMFLRHVQRCFFSPAFKENRSGKAQRPARAAGKFAFLEVRRRLRESYSLAGCARAGEHGRRRAGCPSPLPPGVGSENMKSISTAHATVHV